MICSAWALLVSVFCLTAGEIEAQKSGWNASPNTQYHIQTDEGPERYFRFQTLNGQYRKEKRLADGTVVGTEGWLDPLGYLRIKDYVADSQGYRILRSKMVYVGKDRPIQDAVSIAKKVPAQGGILAKPKRPANPFRQPDLKELPGNGIEAQTVTPLNSHLLPPISQSNHYQQTVSTAAPSPVWYPSINVTPAPYGHRVPLQQLEDGYSQPNTNYLPSAYDYQRPYQNAYPYHVSPPSLLYQPPLYHETASQNDQLIAQRTDHSTSLGYQESTTPTSYPTSYHSDHNVTELSHASQSPYSTPTPEIVYPGQTGQVVRASLPETQPSTSIYPPPSGPNFYPTQNVQSAQSGGQGSTEFPEYDGHHTVKDGFQYYLKTHYHEEQNQPKDDEKIGSFGYIDPFGIRRVIYYKADAEHGFLHKKNNRYVGFQATPYDPQLPSSS